jgi:hypothetical protein
MDRSRKHHHIIGLFCAVSLGALGVCAIGCNGASDGSEGDVASVGLNRPPRGGTGRTDRTTPLRSTDPCMNRVASVLKAASNERDRSMNQTNPSGTYADVYFSADVETDGPIPGPYSMLSFALVVAGRFDGVRFTAPERHETCFVRELRPISSEFDLEALAVNRLDRERLLREGADPVEAMTKAAAWVHAQAGPATPVLVAYPVSFDWTWLFWYFTRFSRTGSPFNHSRCFDLKTAFAVKARRPIARAGRDALPLALRGRHPHTHQALDDAIEQAQIFAKVFAWEGEHE